MKKLIKIWSFIIIAVMLFSLLPLTSCESGTTITVFNWGDYIDEDILKTFKEETGIQVNYSTYARNEDMYEKVKRNPSSYDIVVPSDFMASKMITEGMAEKLDFSNIPNFSNIDNQFIGLSYDPTSEYTVPYMWGTMGILYNTTMVDEVVDSWDILWDEKYSKQIFMYESMRDIMSGVQKKLGFSVNDTNMDNLNAVKTALFEQKPLVQAYMDENIKDKMIGNEGALAMLFSGDAMYCINENDELDYIVPKEGSIVWSDVILIPKGSKNKTEAEMFIDFLCRPDIALANTEYIGYSTPNAETYKLLPEDLQNNIIYWPTEEILSRCDVLLDLGEFTKEYNKAWTEILAAR